VASLENLRVFWVGNLKRKRDAQQWWCAGGMEKIEDKKRTLTAWSFGQRRASFSPVPSFLFTRLNCSLLPNLSDVSGISILPQFV